MTSLQSKVVYHLSHGSSTCSGRKQVLQEACFSHGATQGHPSLVLWNNLITQLFKARPGPNIEDIPLEPYPTDTRKYLIIAGADLRFTPLLRLYGMSSKPICLLSPRKWPCWTFGDCIPAVTVQWSHFKLNCSSCLPGRLQTGHFFRIKFNSERKQVRHIEFNLCSQHDCKNNGVCI